MPGENTSDSLENGIDGGIDNALAAGGMYNTARNMGAAAAEAGKAAAQSAAASGSGVAASAGTGAAVGTAAGPGGTAAGAVIGLAASLLVKPVVKGLIVIILGLVMVFSSLPSMFFEQPVDVADNAGPEAVYAEFLAYAMEKYAEEMDKRKTEIEEAFEERVAAGEFDNYDNVEMTYEFNPPEEVFLAQLAEASNLIISMFEIHTDDWRKATLDDFKRAVDSVYFWNDTIEVEYVDEESEVSHEGEESTLHVHINYNIFDMGVEVFRAKFGLADELDFLKSVEMAYNIGIYFGDVTDLPMGGFTGGGTSGSHPGGGSAGSYPGGGTHNAIRAALAGLAEKREFFGGSAIMPLRSYGSITSEFGPRNYAPDPIHTGIDFAASSGTPIYAAMDGIVLLRLTNTSTFGNHIVIYHGGEITTMYAHMSAFGSYAVGDEVSRGDVIGYVGRTGLSTGDHLHFEYQIGGAANNPRLILPL